MQPGATDSRGNRRVDNVAAVTHCMTRLRFVVKDDEQVDSSTLKGRPGCSASCAAITSAVIIGNTVSRPTARW